MSLLESIGYIAILLFAVIGATVTGWCAFVGACHLGKRLEFAREFNSDMSVPIETQRQIT